MIVSVRVLIEIICHLVGPPSEVVQGTLMEFLLGYSPSEVVLLAGGAAMLNISSSCFRAAVCLSSNVVSVLVGVGLSSSWVRSEAACVVTSFDVILGNFIVAGRNYVMSETLSLALLGM